MIQTIDAAPGGPELWLEAGVALCLLIAAGIARAARAAEEARLGSAGTAWGPARARATSLAAELIWMALLLPGLVLVADVTRILAPPAGQVGAFLAVVLAGLVLSTALPARLGATRPARPTGVPGPWFTRLAYPIRPLVAHLLRRRATLPEPEPAAEEEKLLGRLLDATGEAEGEGEPDPVRVRQLLGRVLHLRETPVARIMQGRDSIVWVGQREPVQVAAELMRASGHSRLPVCGRDLDDVVGFVHRKDVFLSLHGFPASATCGGIARESSLVGAEMPLAVLVAEWRLGSGTMSIVRDGAGRVMGIVTLDDVISWLLAARAAESPDSAPATGGRS